MDKEIGMSDWNSSCYIWLCKWYSVCLHFYLWKNKIPKPYLKKLCALSVNNNKIVNKIICNFGKVTKSQPNLKWSFAPTCLNWINKLRAYLFFINGSFSISNFIDNYSTWLSYSLYNFVSLYLKNQNKIDSHKLHEINVVDLYVKAAETVAVEDRPNVAAEYSGKAGR